MSLRSACNHAGSPQGDFVIQGAAGGDRVRGNIHPKAVAQQVDHRLLDANVRFHPANQNLVHAAFAERLKKLAALATTERDLGGDVRKSLGLADRPWVGFVGQLGNRVKGFDTLYAAWRQLCQRPEWDANLLVVGSGAELPAWQARATADGLAERIAFLGFRSNVSAALAACDAVAHPTRYDAYGLGVHEALCRGLPAIV